MHERRVTESAAWFHEPWPAGDPLMGEPPMDLAPEAGPLPEPPLRPGQILGLVEQVLGARVIAVHRPASRPRTVRPPGDNVP